VKEEKSSRKHTRDLFKNPTCRVGDNIKRNIKERDNGEDSYGLGYGSVAICCKYGNETWGLIKC
jgi:hypothetical protein